MRARLVCVSLLALAAPAGADGAGDSRPIAIAVNPPLRWAFDEARAFGLSAYAGVTSHHAIRVNFARYQFVGNWAKKLAYALVAPEGEGESDEGRVTDVGASWMYFPRRLWSGPSLEAGLLFRRYDTYVVDEYPADGEPEIIGTNTSTYAARALVGWSWLIKNHVFISIAAGVSAGYELGRETTAPDADDPREMRVTGDVRRIDITGETFIRLGGAFDI